VTGSGSPRGNVEKGKADGPIVEILRTARHQPIAPSRETSLGAGPPIAFLNHHYQPMPRRCSESVSKALQVSANRAAFSVTFSTVDLEKIWRKAEANCPRSVQALDFTGAPPRLLRELRLLERRTHRSGKDSVDHGRSGHDDLANVVCACAAYSATDDRDRAYASLRWVVSDDWRVRRTSGVMDPPYPTWSHPMIVGR
jgi:hypothetical protein